jgi:hypothetical protein
MHFNVVSAKGQVHLMEAELASARPALIVAQGFLTVHS